jgi:hypothetical protein
LLILFWLIGGVGMHIGGDLIHLILVVVVICLVIEFLPRLRGGGSG